MERPALALEPAAEHLVWSRAAARRWAQLTAPPHVRQGGGRLPFRRFGALLVALDFAPDRIRLRRIESLAPGSGDFHRLLGTLQDLSQTFDLALHGNARAYATAHVPGPDQSRLLDAYRRHGFQVGAEPLYELTFAPAPPPPG